MPGAFHDKILGDALPIHGKQLFIDDHIIQELCNARKVLNQPTKHPRNPLIVRDKPWEGRAITHASVVRDPDDGVYKIWYTVWQGTLKAGKALNCTGRIAYATSPDGITWEKPLFNEKEKNNLVTFTPPMPWVVGPSVLIEPFEKDPKRRYKMMFLCRSDGTAKTLGVFAAYSADGMHWEQEPSNPVATFGDGPPNTYWDASRQRYVAHIRYYPPNTRTIAQIESQDFVHWSPKVMVVDYRGYVKYGGRTKLDRRFRSAYQMMAAQPYEDVYIGQLVMHHGETIQPIPEEEKAWADKIDTQLTFSRNGMTWQRVGPEGAIPTDQQHTDEEWKRMAERAAFLPYGEYKKDWDWGWAYSFEPPFVVVGDEIRIYYLGMAARHWWIYHKDGDVPAGQSAQGGFGLATLRLDGFVSVEAGEREGTLMTKPLAFIADVLEVNADAGGGEIRVEALDLHGNVIEGFSRDDCEPISTDSVRHLMKWNGSDDISPLQAWPLCLKFYIQNAKLFSFNPRILHKHYKPHE